MCRESGLGQVSPKFSLRKARKVLGHRDFVRGSQCHLYGVLSIGPDTADSQ